MAKRYKLMNDNDGNDEIELQSTTYDEAVQEAFEQLGWNLIEMDLDDDEFCDQCEDNEICDVVDYSECPKHPASRR